MPITDPECDHILCGEGWATITPLTWNIVHEGGMDEPDIAL